MLIITYSIEQGKGSPSSVLTRLMSSKGRLHLRTRSIEHHGYLLIVNYLIEVNNVRLARASVRDAPIDKLLPG